MAHHTCDACGVGFQRAEHLSRHKLRHLGQRSFSCPQCELGFSRRDTLQRHLTVHNKNDERLPLAGSKRRTKHACRDCSQSKLRCDGRNPCHRCLSKNHICSYDSPRSSSAKQSSPPQLWRTHQHISDADIGTNTEAQNIVTSQPHFPAPLTVPLAHSGGVQPDFTPTRGAYKSVACLDNSSGDISASSSSMVLKQLSLPLGDAGLEHTALDHQLLNFDQFSTAAQEIALWDDPQYSSLLYQGPYADFGFLTSPEQTQPFLWETSLSEPELDDCLSDAPVPSFLDARSSPEPLEGQGLRFDDYLRKTFGHRHHLRNSTGNAQANGTARSARTTSVRTEKAHYPPLLGAFSPVLTSHEGGDDIWEPENLAHVKPLPQQCHDEIVAKFKKFNKTNDQYTQFATGDFPSLAACNAFMQLYFEEFNPLFPLLHQPTFDPAIEPWLLVLAVIATGCRFSKVSTAKESVDLLQEFVRRAFYATIEKDYSSTCEPWLAQAGLLNQIGMQFSKDLRLTESAQSMRSLLASLCRKVNCFTEPDRHIDITDLQQLSMDDNWKLWIRRESMRRLAYTLWLVDSQYILFFDLPPIIPTNLLRVRLPSSENLWNAPTASVWNEHWKQNSKAPSKLVIRSLISREGTCLPLSIRHELSHLYKTKVRRQGLGDFVILLLVLGVFRSALEFRRSFQEGFNLQASVVNQAVQHSPESEPVTETFTGTRKAMEYLRILCPEYEDVRRLSSLKSAILHHYHTIGIVLGIPLAEIFCYCGYRVTSLDISRCQNRLKIWVQQRGREARQVAFHASRLFADIRHSDMYGYYESRAMMIACVCLWIYGEIAGQSPTFNDVEATSGTGHLMTSTIRLDQQLSGQLEQSWVEDGAEMRPYLAGVGNILGHDGVNRLVQEGVRVLCASNSWPMCGVMGKALQIFHKLRSGSAL